MKKCINSSVNCLKSNYLQFGKFPIANFPVNLKKFNIFKKKLKFNSYRNLDFLICKKCNYIQLKNKPNENILDQIYSKFYKYPSAILKQFYPTRDNFFLKSLFANINLKKIQKILEIGCYDGYILNEIKNKFPNVNVAGCEPSEGADIANRFKLNVKKTFFNRFTFKNQSFDLIIIRHTLEHIHNLRKILTDIKSVMKSNSTLVIEVPNINFYLKKGLLEVFSFQHIHYFSSKSFWLLAKKYNFKIIKSIKTPENLIIYLKLGKNFSLLKKNNFLKNSKNFTNIFNKNKEKIHKILSKYKSNQIAVWGAGGFAFAAAYLYNLPLNQNSLIVDNDKVKHGLFFYEKKIKIQPVYGSALNNKKLIIITSYYSKQIISEVKKMKIKINILQIFPVIKLIKL
jgi:SAM-dependent methyltransferase